MTELKPESAYVYKLGTSSYGMININIKSDAEIDIFVTDEKISNYFLETGKLLKEKGTIYHRVKSKSFEKSIASGSDSRSLIIINRNPNNIKYSINIDEVGPSYHTAMPVAGVIGYTGPGFPR